MVSVLETRMFASTRFHSSGALVPNVVSLMHFLVMHLFSDISAATVSPNQGYIYQLTPTIEK